MFSWDYRDFISIFPTKMLLLRRVRSCDDLLVLRGGSGSGSRQFGVLQSPNWQSIMRVIWEFHKIRGTFLGVPIIRIIVFWGLYWGPPILGNYHIKGCRYNLDRTQFWDITDLPYEKAGLGSNRV